MARARTLTRSQVNQTLDLERLPQNVVLGLGLHKTLQTKGLPKKETRTESWLALREHQGPGKPSLQGNPQ